VFMSLSDRGECHWEESWFEGSIRSIGPNTEAILDRADEKNVDIRCVTRDLGVNRRG
jgi:hypothetical protein